MIRDRLFSVSVISLFFILLNSQTGYCDKVTLDTGDTVLGVITREDGKSLLISTSSGPMVIERKQTVSVIHSKPFENFLLLARFAKENGDLIRSYYLYRQSYQLNTLSREAVDGMLSVQNSFIEPDMTEEALALSSLKNYSRYLPLPKGVDTEKDLLTLNSETVQRLSSEKGLILEQTTYGTKVNDVIAGKWARERGMEIDDYIKRVDGQDTMYMGMLDIAEVLLDKDGDVPITVEREVRLWIPPMADITEEAFREKVGLALSYDDAITVTEVASNSPAEHAGLIAGDTIMQINDQKITDSSFLSIRSVLTSHIPDVIRIIIRRDLSDST